ncbi:Ser-Thr-rich glycosyl-phosphatidyl-inositol-anchored membrane family-domain-containing protein [Aspergillus avenaceus]|uniref:Ser-Thr-rich glycosyl-phosphatidyl-inositol-anchored membrane family-domain-containing protein n=1 Tax=Aspergillus avenaceus TaxID=36643 RepID=A0A5N6TZW8_ASPAV|nr:Ser-Thr-rich glycosyl-phosphatidyl-inositol-anchored membrane family-domain-containing protein [Aspergillus avenaceus]
MRFLYAAISALAALATAHTDPDTSQAPSGNPIYTPSLNEQVPVGKPYSITWNPTTEAAVSVVLLRGPSTNVVPIDTLAEQIPNSGKFEWTPSTSLEDDTTHYGLMIVVEGTGQYQYSTQFGISNPGAAVSSSSASTSAAAPATTTSATTEAAAETSNADWVSYEVTTTICDCETQSTAAPVATTNSAPVIPPGQTYWGTGTASVPVVSPTNTPYLPSTLRSSANPSGTASSTTPGVPLFTSGADRNAISFGAAAAGVFAVLAF